MLTVASKVRYLVVLLVGVLCLTQLSAAPVTKMVVKGNQRVEADTIRALLEPDTDGGFSEQALNRSLTKLFDSGYFADVRLDQKGNTLFVYVKENPMVNEIAIEGNKELGDEVLKPELTLKPRQMYTQARLKADVEKIQTLYRLKGHFAAVVTPKLIRRDQNRVDIIFEVNEGGSTKVSKIFFVGNTQFGESKLESVLQTKESRWYRFFTNDDTYDPDRLAYDRELLRLFYLQHGYADFKVKSAVAELTADRKEFFITFTLDEGPRYRVGKIKITAKSEKIDVSGLQSVVKVASGDWYNSKEVESAIDALTNELGRRGYAFVEIDPNLERKKDQKIVDINFEVQEGPKVYIDKIQIAGNYRTDDDVVRRELLFFEGDAFNADKLKRSERNLRNLGFFKNVKVNREASEFPDRVNIVIEVEEDRTAELSIGGGFSTADGPLADLKFGERNFRGRGQDLSASVTYGKRRQDYNISFTEPYFMGYDFAAGFDLFRIIQSKYFDQTFDQKLFGGALRGGFFWMPDLNQQLYYTLRQDEITNIKAEASRFIREQGGKKTLSEVSQTFTYDKRDNRISPTEGYFLGFSNSYAGVGGDVRYLKNSAFAGYYYPLMDEWIFHVSATFNIMDGLGKKVRVVDRYTGGGESLRGFALSGVSPRDKVTGDPLGGLKSYFVTTEMSFPIGLPNEFGVKGAAFVDAGSVFDADEPKKFVTDKRGIRVSAGVGLRWRSPMGPFFIDFGFPLKKQKEDKKQLVFFGVSTRF